MKYALLVTRLRELADWHISEMEKLALDTEQRTFHSHAAIDLRQSANSLEDES